MLPDISSIRYWAMWDLRKTPYYRLYLYCYYIPAPSDVYVFKERKTGVFFAQKLPQLAALYITGTFRPFVIATPPAATYYTPPGGSA
jgi:hypothetical protein